MSTYASTLAYAAQRRYRLERMVDFTAETPASFLGAASGTYTDSRSVAWDWSYNGSSGSTWGVTASGLQWVGIAGSTTEVYVRASIADLIACGHGPAYSPLDRILMVAHYTALSLTVNTQTVHCRYELSSDYKPRVEFSIGRNSGANNRSSTIESDDASDSYVGTTHSTTDFYIGMEWAGSLTRGRYSATEITSGSDGVVWDGATPVWRSPRFDDDLEDLGAVQYLKLGGYYLSGIGAWTLASVKLYRWR